jgi:hypothetical protein
MVLHHVLLQLLAPFHRAVALSALEQQLGVERGVGAVLLVPHYGTLLHREAKLARDYS